MPKIEIPISELRKRKLMIATPMYGGLCMGSYMKSCLDLVAFSAKYQIPIQFNFIFNESLIGRARCYLADEFMRSDCNYLMFIDADIEFDPQDIFMLLAMDMDVVGAPYSKKTIACERIYDAVKLGLVDDNPLKLEDYMGDFVFNPIPGTKEINILEPVEVLETGTGFMMIRKNVLEGFQKAYPERMFRPDHNRTRQFDGSREICEFFPTGIEPKSRRLLSEDYYFCQLTREAGYHIWLCPWMKLKHAGTYIYGGNMEALAVLSHAQVAAGKVTRVPKDRNDNVLNEVNQNAPTTEVPNQEASQETTQVHQEQEVVSSTDDPSPL